MFESALLQGKPQQGAQPFKRGQCCPDARGAKHLEGGTPGVDAFKCRLCRMYDIYNIFFLHVPHMRSPVATDNELKCLDA